MEFDPDHNDHKLLLIKIKQETVIERGTLYEACRYSWRLNKKRAEKVEYVLAIVDGVCRGVFKPSYWKKLADGKLAFEGNEIYDEVANRYLNKRIP